MMLGKLCTGPRYQDGVGGVGGGNDPFAAYTDKMALLRQAAGTGALANAGTGTKVAQTHAYQDLLDAGVRADDPRMIAIQKDIAAGNYKDAAKKVEELAVNEMNALKAAIKIVIDPGLEEQQLKSQAKQADDNYYNLVDALRNAQDAIQNMAANDPARDAMENYIKGLEQMMDSARASMARIGGEMNELDDLDTQEKTLVQSIQDREKADRDEARAARAAQQQVEDSLPKIDSITKDLGHQTIIIPNE